MSRKKRIVSAASDLYEEYGAPLVDSVVDALSAKKPAPKKSLAAKPAAPAIVKKVSGANKRAASKPTYDREKIARQYPDTAKPSLAIDKKSGKEFLQKELSPEAEALGVARREAQRDIERGEFTPFFDPATRFYADPSPYALQGNTLTDVLPKRADTIAKYEAMARDPDAMDRLRGAYERGAEVPNAKDWYAMGQLEDAFLQEYGPEVGRQMFKERFADSMAATTGGADPTSNLLMATYGNKLREGGLDLPAASYDLPFPIGGRYAANNMAMFDKVINKGSGLTTANPKRFNFSANFLGDTGRATIDEQMSGLFQPGLMLPAGDSYGIYEKALGDLAAKYKLNPANFQDVAWAGGKLAKTPKFEPKPMIQIVNEAIERTARVTGQDPEEVVYEGMVKAKRPMYAEGGVVSAPIAY
jgi:hypothetical protein